MSMRWLGLLLLSVLMFLPRGAEAAVSSLPDPISVTDAVDGATATTGTITITGDGGDNGDLVDLVVGTCVGTPVGTLGSFTLTPNTNFAMTTGGTPVAVAYTAALRGTFTCPVTVYTTGLRTVGDIRDTFEIRGIGQASELQITTAGPLDFGSVRTMTATTLTASQSITLRNAGELPLEVTALDLSGTDLADWAISPMPTLPFTLAAATNRSLTAVFDPSATGTRTATLTVTSDDPIDIDDTLALTGVGTAAVIAVTDRAFGIVNVGQTGTGDVQVTNTATDGGILTLGTATIAGGSWFAFGGTGGCTGGAVTCTPTLPTTFPKTLPLTCSPPADAMGSQTATVTIASDSDPVADNVAMLSCTAGRATATVDTASVAFGAAVVGTTTAVQTVMLENTGNVALGYSLARTGTNSNQFTLGAACVTNCSLAAGAQTAIEVAFAPTSMGAKSASLTITSNDLASPTLDVALTGTGTAGIASVTPASIPFGTIDVGATATGQVITVTNTGTSDLTISNASFATGAADYAALLGITGAQTTVIGPTMTASWTVACAPSTQGSRPGTFRIVTNSGGTAGQNSDVGLSCTGLRGRLAIAATSHNFGAVSAGTTATQTFTLSNTGNVAVNAISATVDSATVGYAVTAPTLPITSLAAGATVTITVQFAPLSGADGGPATVTFAGSWGASATPSTTVLSLDGDGLSAGYDVSVATLAFGDLRYDATATRVVCLTNTSQSNVSITATTITPATGTTTGEFAVISTHRRACGATTTATVTLPQALTPGQTLEMVVRVDPANRVGAMAATLTINSNLATNPTRTVDLTATSTSAMITTTPGVSVDFGNVDLQAGAQTRDIVITNTGNATLDLGAFSRTANARFTLTLPGATTLAPAQALTVVVTYTPTTEAAPLQADTFTLTHSVAGDIANVPGSQTITVRGRGVDRHLALDPVPAFPATFRNPGAAAPVRSIKVTNTGEATLVISAVMVTNTEVWQVDATPVDIAGGASHEFAVTFSPTVAGPAPQGVLVLTNDDDQQPMATVLLDGLGVDRMVVMGDPVIDLGLAGIGVPVSLDGALTVTSTDPTTGFVIRAIEVEDAAFALDGDTADVALAPSASVAFGVTFSPDREGEFETRARLFLDADPLAQAEVTLKGRAVFVDATGGGGCQASGSGSGATGGLVLILAGVLAARRRRRAAVAGALATALLPALARAQSAELDLSLFNPTPSTVGTTIQLQPAGVGTSGSLATMAVASYATNPLILNLGGDQHLAISQRSTLELGVAYAFLGRLEAGLRLPLYSQAGDGEMVGVGSPSGTAVGDLTAHLRAQLLRSTGASGLVLGLGGQVTVPTASGDQFAGVDGPSGKAQLLVSLNPTAARSRFTLTANAGAVIRPSTQLSNIEQGSGATFGAGVSVRVLDALWVIGEAFGEVVPGGRRDGVMASASALVTAEYLGGLTYRPTRQLALGLAAGRGLIAGVGTPDLRGVFSLTVTPSARALAPIYPPPPPPIDGDEDGDGLKDSKDRCPDEAEDMDQFDDTDGCPDPDNDKDGVIDAADKCVLEAEDRDGFEDGDGCPDADNDGDGVTDVADMCPLVPEDKDGFADDDGCAEKDNDKDGIDDDADKCPIQEESINGVDDDDGCPDKGDSLVIMTPSALELLEPIQFTGAKLSPKSTNLLGQIAATLRARPDIVRFKVVVHLNPSGDAAKDLDVSTKRAQAVRDWIVQWGIAASRVSAQGLGGKKPLVPATQKGAASINERAELIILERQ